MLLPVAEFLKVSCIPWTSFPSKSTVVTLLMIKSSDHRRAWRFTVSFKLRILIADRFSGTQHILRTSSAIVEYPHKRDILE